VCAQTGAMRGCGQRLNLVTRAQQRKHEFLCLHTGLEIFLFPQCTHTHMHMAAGIIIMFWCALGLVGAFGVYLRPAGAAGGGRSAPPLVRPSVDLQTQTIVQAFTFPWGVET
jgi:hypothetical protein